MRILVGVLAFVVMSVFLNADVQKLLFGSVEAYDRMIMKADSAFKNTFGRLSGATDPDGDDMLVGAGGIVFDEAITLRVAPAGEPAQGGISHEALLRQMRELESSLGLPTGACRYLEKRGRVQCRETARASERAAAKVTGSCGAGAFCKAKE